MFRAVDLGLAKVMVTRAGEWNVLSGGFLAMYTEATGWTTCALDAHGLSTQKSASRSRHLINSAASPSVRDAAPQWPVDYLAVVVAVTEMVEAGN